MTPVYIRWMIRRDIPEVLNIERQAFEYPWNKKTFLYHLQQRNEIGMVAEYEEKIVGYMVYGLHKRRIELLNIAARPERHGIGTQLLDKLKLKMNLGRRCFLQTMVRDKNLGAQLFFKSQGFRADDVVRGYYEECDDDAYLFRYCLSVEAAV